MTDRDNMTQKSGNNRLSLRSIILPVTPTSVLRYKVHTFAEGELHVDSLRRLLQTFRAN